MIRIRQGVVTEILAIREDLREVKVRIDNENEESKAVNYERLIGPVEIGDRVILNTTAVYKKLGTGGSHFIIGVLNNTEIDIEDEGHLMKLRYTPCQVKCFGVDEQDSPNHEIFNNFSSLNNMPVVIGELHSMVPGISATIKKISNNKLKIAYIMTDGAALPIAFSQLVAKMKDKNMIDTTITIGNAFGGDLEAVNIYNGLIAAKEVAKADIAIVAMGPGITGTGTKYGFTGIEQGEVINAVNTLGGHPILVPRISFADARERHQGISHHTITLLSVITKTTCTIAIPKLNINQNKIIMEQITRYGIDTKHSVKEISGEIGVNALQNDYQLKVTTMGRGIAEEKPFFLACGAAGALATNLFFEKQSR